MTSTAESAVTPGADFTEHSVAADGFTVRYFEAGQGDPLIVLHGAGGPRFTVALDLLATRRRVILIEMPGFGAEPNTRTQTLAEMAGTVAAAVQALGIDRYHLLGTAFGGAVAVRLALAAPDRLISLVLEAPATFLVGAVPPGQAVRAFRMHRDRSPAFEPPDPAAMAIFLPLVDRLLASQPAYDEEVAGLLPQCFVRTLVLFGDEDGVIPAGNGRTFRRLMPNCVYILVHDAAHDIQGGRAEAFADVVGGFLDRGLQFLLPDASNLIHP